MAAIPALSLAQVQAPAPGKDSAEIIKEMGPLADSLVAAFSMDDSPNGSDGLFPPARAGELGVLQCANSSRTAERQCASFAGQKSGLTVFGAITLGTKLHADDLGQTALSLATARPSGTAAGSPLFVQGEQFMCSGGGTDYSLGEYNKALDRLASPGHHLRWQYDLPLHRWHDQRHGARGDRGIVRRIGSRTFPDKDVNSQCDLLDDMFIFDRALAARRTGDASPGCNCRCTHAASDGLRPGRPPGATNATFPTPDLDPIDHLDSGEPGWCHRTRRNWSRPTATAWSSSAGAMAPAADLSPTLGGKTFLADQRPRRRRRARRDL